MQAQASSQAELRAVQAELQGATEMLDTMQEMASSSMEGQEEAQKQMDALTAQLQAAIQVGPFGVIAGLLWGYYGVKTLPKILETINQEILLVDTDTVMPMRLLLLVVDSTKLHDT